MLNSFFFPYEEKKKKREKMSCISATNFDPFR